MMSSELLQRYSIGLQVATVLCSCCRSRAWEMCAPNNVVFGDRSSRKNSCLSDWSTASSNVDGWMWLGAIIFAEVRARRRNRKNDEMCVIAIDANIWLRALYGRRTNTFIYYGSLCVVKLATHPSSCPQLAGHWKVFIRSALRWVLTAWLI